MATDGHGTTITFGTSGFSANLLEIGGVSLERAAIDSTHMGTANAKAYIPTSLYDGGSVDITFEFVGNENVPIDAAVETITINWAGANAWSFSGFMTGFTPSAQTGEKMQASATLKITGAVSGI